MRFSLSFITHRKSFRSYLGLSAVTFFLLTMVSGCAVERNVKDNRFYSSFPKAVIEVDKKFDYLGSGKYQTSGLLNMEHEFFVFSGKIDKKTIQKGIVIQFAITQSKYYSQGSPYLFKTDYKQKNIFAYGHKLIGGNSYDYYVICTNQMIQTYGRGNIESGNEIGKWLNEKGYMLPRCGLHQRIIDFGIDSHKVITYVEDATLSGIDCDKWYDKNQLTEKQRQYIDEFSVRADKALKFIDF
jgi:hypothetical protein